MKYADSRATLAATANKRHQPPKQHSLIQWRGGCGAFYYTHSARASQIKKSLFTAGPQFPRGGGGSCILAALTELIFAPIDFAPLFMRPTDIWKATKKFTACVEREPRWKLVFQSAFSARVYYCSQSGAFTAIWCDAIHLIAKKKIPPSFPRQTWNLHR